MTSFSHVLAALCLSQVHGTEHFTAEQAHQHLLAAAPANDVGKYLHCFGERAHEVTYNIDPKAESLKTCEACVVMVQPAPEMNDVCRPKFKHLPFESGCDPLKGVTKKCPWKNISRSSDLCFGANMDKSCKSAKESIPLGRGSDWSCSNCYVGLDADLRIEIIYIKALAGLLMDLGMAQITISNTHLRGGLEFQGKRGVSTTLAKGDFKLPNAPKITGVFTVGTLPVKVDVTVPTTLSYSITAKAEASITAGVAVDLQFTDTSARWVDDKNNKKKGGITTVNGKLKSFNVTPKLELKAELSMKFELALKTGLEVEISDIMSYRVNVVPKIPLKITYPIGKQPCISASADLDVTHSADVHLPGGFFFPDKTVISWPLDGKPAELFSTSKPLYKKCFGGSNAVMVV